MGCEGGLWEGVKKKGRVGCERVGFKRVGV